MQRGLVTLILCLGAVAVQAQWVNYPTPGLPRGKDGHVVLNGPAPRAKDGKPDLSGVWHVQPTGLAEMKRLFGHDVDALDVDITFVDPAVYTRPFTIAVTHVLQPDTDVLEYFCNENEKDQIHIINAK